MCGGERAGRSRELYHASRPLAKAFLVSLCLVSRRRDALSQYGYAARLFAGNMAFSIARFMRQGAQAVRTYASVASAHTSSSLAPTGKTPHNVLNTKGPKRFAYQDKRKGFSERKTFLFKKYERLLRENELVLLFKMENLDVKLLNDVRRQASLVKIPCEDLARLEEKNNGVPWNFPTCSLTMIRTGLMRPVCRKDTAQPVQALEPHLRGQLAMLTCPVLSPEYIGKVLRAMERPVAAAVDAHDPKSAKKAPLFKPIVAVAERSRLVDTNALPAFTKLPNLPTLRAQLVGLLSAPGQKIAGLLSQAGGGELAATLEARRRDMEKPGTSAESASEA